MIYLPAKYCKYALDAIYTMIYTLVRKADDYYDDCKII